LCNGTGIVKPLGGNLRVEAFGRKPLDGMVRSPGMVSRFAFRGGLKINPGWQAGRGGKRVKPWVCLDWLGVKADCGVSSDTRR